MSDLSKLRKPISVRVLAWERGRQLVIEMDRLHPAEILVRESGRRKGYWVPVRAIYTTGAKLEAERIRREKAEGSV